MSQQLLKRQPCLCSAKPAKAPIRRRVAVLVRAEGKVVREYREDDNTLVDSSKPQSASKDMYVQDVQVQQKRLTKEYRSKLMEEYVGLGGSENKAMSQNWFLYMMVIVSSLAVACKMIGAL